MTKQMAASWRRLAGIALLWVALAALFRMSPAGGGTLSPWLALLGFACFAGGLSLFADGMKRSIVADLQGAAQR